MYKLKFNKEYRDFQCKIKVDEKEIEISVIDFEEDNIEEAEKLLNSVLNWFESNKQKLREYAATKDLIELKNEVWLEEGESGITKEEFMNRIVLESISIFSEGDFEIWYGDGDIFWGHAVKVDISRDFQLVDSSMM